MMGVFSRSLDIPSSRLERVIFAVHLLHCPACRRSRRQILLLVSALRRFSGAQSGRATGPIPGLPAAARERIKRALRQG